MQFNTIAYVTIEKAFNTYIKQPIL
jgi:hypothetical protein